MNGYGDKVLPLLLGLGLFLGGCTSIPTNLKKTFVEFSPQSKNYFPHEDGMEWWYQGEIIGDTLFASNYGTRSRVRGKKKINGVTVTIFDDSNPQNLGSAESYYHIDEAGVIYYGAKPIEVFDKQLVPFRIIEFPIRVDHSFEPVKRKRVNLGEDLDGDGKDEMADVKSKVSVVRKESVTVKAGTYLDSILVKTQLFLTIYLSSSGKTTPAEFTLKDWYAEGVGRVKSKMVSLLFVPISGIKKRFLSETTEELLGVRTKIDREQR